MIKLIAFILVLFFVISCEKTSPFDELGFYGEGTAILNGIAWKGNTGVFKAKDYCSDSCIAIQILQYNNLGELRSKILFDFIPLISGKFIFNVKDPPYLDTLYKVKYSEFTSDGDVITGVYYLEKKDTASFIDITKLDKATGNIKGNFQVKVVRLPLYVPIGSIPDTVKIEDGSFYGIINWR